MGSLLTVFLSKSPIHRGKLLLNCGSLEIPGQTVLSGVPNNRKILNIITIELSPEMIFLPSIISNKIIPRAQISTVSF